MFAWVCGLRPSPGARCRGTQAAHHLPAQGREGASVVQRTQHPQLVHGVENVILRGRVHEVELHSSAAQGHGRQRGRKQGAHGKGWGRNNTARPLHAHCAVAAAATSTQSRDKQVGAERSAHAHMPGIAWTDRTGQEDGVTPNTRTSSRLFTPRLFSRSTMLAKLVR